MLSYCQSLLSQNIAQRLVIATSSSNMWQFIVSVLNSDINLPIFVFDGYHCDFADFESVCPR